MGYDDLFSPSSSPYIGRSKVDCNLPRSSITIWRIRPGNTGADCIRRGQGGWLLMHRYFIGNKLRSVKGAWAVKVTCCPQGCTLKLLCRPLADPPRTQRFCRLLLQFEKNPSGRNKLQLRTVVSHDITAVQGEAAEYTRTTVVLLLVLKESSLDFLFDNGCILDNSNLGNASRTSCTSPCR